MKKCKTISWTKESNTCMSNTCMSRDIQSGDTIRNGNGFAVKFECLNWMLVLVLVYQQKFQSMISGFQEIW
jgi:hypothetical protein